MNIWYQLLTDTIRGPFLEEQCKPVRIRPVWTRDLGYLRKEVRRLYDGGYRRQSGELGHMIQIEYRKRVRARKTQLATEFIYERSPSRGLSIRRAYGIVPGNDRARSWYWQHLRGVFERRKRIGLPIQITTTFVVSSEFTHDMRQSVERVKKGRAAGPFGMYGEMLTVSAPWVKHIMVDFWRLCGQLKTMPIMWHTLATEPAYKNGPTDDPSLYRPIGIVTMLLGTIDNAFQRYMSRRYQAHSAQHGFGRGVATEQVILRVLNSSRKRAAPLVLLDIKSAYPSVPRWELVEMVRVRVDPELASIALVRFKSVSVKGCKLHF
jgi:hypothetical protein